jgi:hypothetical protein
VSVVVVTVVVIAVVVIAMVVVVVVVVNVDGMPVLVERRFQRIAVFAVVGGMKNLIPLLVMIVL